MKTGEKHGLLLPLLAVVLAAGLAYTMVMDPLSKWLSQEQLVEALSSTVPEWRGDWIYSGARTATYAAPDLLLLCLAGFSALTLWLAGLCRAPVPRALWLLAALCTSIGIIGAGDPRVLYSVSLSVPLIAWVILACRVREKRRFYFDWNGGVAKVMLFSLLTCVGVYFAMSFAWGSASVVTEVSLAFNDWVTSAILIVLVGMVVAIARVTRESSGLGGPLIAATLAAVCYTGPGMTGFGEAWRARRSELVKWTESADWRNLRTSFAETRLSEAEASVQRAPRPEVNTLWTRREELAKQAAQLGDEGKTASGWLAADEALYSGKTGADRERLNKTAMTRLAETTTGPVTSEMTGWLRLDAGDNAGAASQFRNALSTQPAAPMRWLGLAMAEAGSGRDDAAAKALATWCLLDPRAVFSPAWQRAPLDKLRPAAMRRWTEAATGLIAADALSANDIARLQRFTGWLSAWDRSAGNPTKFLDDAQSPVPTAGAVRMVRERMKETLLDPTDAKIGAIFSAGTALLADRHVNLGQCHEIFDAMRAGKTGAAESKATILISRPVMPGWPDACRITEGGAGATLHDFEENLVVRLLTYGHESAHIQIPDKFLREALPK